jgi:hypothetical protein
LEDGRVHGSRAIGYLKPANVMRNARLAPPYAT